MLFLYQQSPPNDGLALRSGQEDDYRRDTIERDEKRLAELGRKTVEMYVIAHVFTERLEVSFSPASGWCAGGVGADGCGRQGWGLLGRWS